VLLFKFFKLQYSAFVCNLLNVILTFPSHLLLFIPIGYYNFPMKIVYACLIVFDNLRRETYGYFNYIFFSSPPVTSIYLFPILSARKEAGNTLLRWININYELKAPF